MFSYNKTSIKYSNIIEWSILGAILITVERWSFLTPWIAPKCKMTFRGASQHKSVHLCKISEKNIDGTVTQSDHSGQKCKWSY